MRTSSSFFISYFSTEQRLDLFDGVIHLHIEQLLAKLRRRPASVAADAVVDARLARVRLLSWRWDRIAERILHELLARPALVAAEIEHLAGVGNAGVRAAGIT